MKTSRLLIFAITILLLCSLVACELSSYSAIGLVKQTKNNYCRASFMRLEGKLVLTPRFTDYSEGTIHYTATLEQGEVNVYYEGVGVKQLLFNIKAGESIDSRGGYIEKGKQTIIIETVSPAKGEIIINFEH